MSFTIKSPEVEEAVAKSVQMLLNEMVADGAPNATTDLAMQCAGKLFKIIADYEDAGLMAMGCLGETLVRLFDLENEALRNL